MWVNNIRQEEIFSKKFFNYFFTGEILPGCRVLWVKKQQKNIYLTDKIAREASRRWAILSYNIHVSIMWVANGKLPWLLFGLVRL